MGLNVLNLERTVTRRKTSTRPGDLCSSGVIYRESSFEMRLLGVIHRESSIELCLSMYLGGALSPAKAIEKLPGQGQWTLSIRLLV